VLPDEGAKHDELLLILDREVLDDHRSHDGGHGDRHADTDREDHRGSDCDRR